MGVKIALAGNPNSGKTQFFVGYVLALNAYQFGRLATSGTWGFWTVVAALVDVWVLWMVFRPMPKALKEVA